MQPHTPTTAPTTGPTTAAVVPPTMQAITQERYGSVDTWRLDRTAPPTIAADAVLIRTRAAGLDRGTWHLMTGKPYLLRLAFGLRRPTNPVPGTDFSGTVAAVGSGITKFAVGEEVYGFGRGTFAQYTTAKEDKLARKPVNLSFEQAATVPVSAVTALQGLRKVGHLQSGQSVLITGASGGVGSYAVQLAKAFGAEVTGVASTAKLDLVRSLGADHVIDYTAEDFADGTHRYDLVLDIAGNPTLNRLQRALNPTGTAVISGGEEGGSFSGGMNRQLRAVALSPFLRKRLAMFITKQRASDLEQLTELIEAGTLRPNLERTYPLEGAANAIDHLEAGRVRGKVALTV